MGKLIKSIPGSCILISSLPGSASRMHVESLGKPHDVRQQAFSKPCLVNLISKDTHFVFSIYCLFNRRCRIVRAVPKDPITLNLSASDVY